MCGVKRGDEDVARSERFRNRPYFILGGRVEFGKSGRISFFHHVTMCSSSVSLTQHLFIDGIESCQLLSLVLLDAQILRVRVEEEWWASSSDEAHRISGRCLLVEGHCRL